MDVFLKFFYEFFITMLRNIAQLFVDLWNNIVAVFNVVRYAEIFESYSKDFNAWAWVCAILTLVLLLAVIVLIIWLIVIAIRRHIKYRKKNIDKTELLDTVDELNSKVLKLMNENEKLLALKVAQLGVRPGEDENALMQPDENSRFVKLTAVDNFYLTAPYELADEQNYTLTDLVTNFRNYAANRLKLYYEEEIIRLFIAGMGTSRIIILEGISGTGKTSLPYAFGKFCKYDSAIIPVQPSWRDKAELIGYFNEFTKKFNETDFFKSLYDATYRENVGLIVLDEMNLARIEYYFAEILSVLEMPDRSDWKIDVVPDTWPSDPKHLNKGKLLMPTNIWFVGTANNDDSTFTITDKIYDRATPIAINTKGVPFEAPEAEPIEIEETYLEALFIKAKADYPISQELLDKFDELDNFVITNFRLAFGNRILKQMKDFVPIYVACGGSEIDGIDFILTYKILRKFEGLNIAFAVDNLKKLVSLLDKLFGRRNMRQAKEYIKRLIDQAM